MRSAIIFTALALIAGCIVPRYAARLPAALAPTALPLRSPAAAAADVANSRSIIVPRDASGQFKVDARVDGRRLNFLVDTGASMIALSMSEATRLGFHPPPREFVAEVKTANGIVRAALAQLDLVEVGDLAVRDVAAVILPDQTLSDNLLGLSFLSRLRRFEYSDGKLVLEQ
jgi:aspartyl protease family protein